MERQYIGIDLHKASFHACAVTETGMRLWEASFPRSAEGIAALAAREVAGAQLAVEATGPTWAFVDAVAAIGVQACVVDPRKTKLKAGFAAKTDRLDARRLADALRRESVVSIYIPPPPIRQLRELCRGRQQLVRLRTRAVQAIRALLLRLDGPEPPVTSLIGVQGLAWLKTVHVEEASERALRRPERVLLPVHAEARPGEGAGHAPRGAGPGPRGGPRRASAVGLLWVRRRVGGRAGALAPARFGTGGSRGRGRRGSAGRWWKRRCMRPSDRMRAGGGCVG